MSIQLNAKQLVSLITGAIVNRQPILITGAPGIGKTDLIKASVELVRVKCSGFSDVQLLIMHPCVSDPTDFKGMPALIDGQAVFLPFNDLEKLMNATVPTVCFFDDIGQAPPAVQAALMQLLLAREINGKKISDSVVFIAATNRKQDKAGVSGMLEPVKSRFTTIVEMIVDHKSWIEWAINADLPIELISFIQFRPNLLHDFKASSDLVNSPCPRTVANLGKLIKMQLPADIQHAVYSGAVGEGFATEFLSFLPIMRKLPKIENIIAGNDSQAPDDLSVCFAVSIALARKANDNNIGNVLKYVQSMIPEFQVMFIKSATKLNVELFETKEVKLWCTKNADVLI